jgi:hypothetical protein
MDVGRDERTSEELYSDLLKADWNISNTGYSTYGATVTFRHHYTSDFPGMTTRTVHGKDQDDAIRIFLKQLEEERAGGS